MGDSPAALRATLTLASGPSTGRTYGLAAEAVYIGRTRPCDVILASSGVSRQHARIELRDSGFVIEDLGSLNGTFVNGQRIHGSQRLSAGDTLQIHDSLLTFDLTAIPTAPNATAPPEVPRESPRTSVVAALDVRYGDHSRVEVNPEIKLHALLDLIRNLGAAPDLDQALHEVLDRVFEIFPQADHGFILLYDPEKETLVPEAIKHRRPEVLERTLGPINNQVAMQSLLEGQAILSADIAGNEAISQSETIFDIQLRAILCAPLITPLSDPLGVLQLVTDDSKRQFAQPDLDVLASIGLLVGQLVAYARRFERKGAAEALRRSESRFRALIEKSYDSISLINAQGEVVYSTPSVTQQLGYSPDEVAGMSAFDFIHPDDLPTVLHLFDDLLAERGAVRTSEYRVRHLDGTYRWLEVTGTNLLHDPAVQGVVCNYRDITGRKQLEQQRTQLLEEERHARAEAERLSRMKDEFLATLSHELRTPLNAILGWADLLQTGTLASAEVEQALETIRRNSRLQAKIIDDLLDMSRIVSGRIRLDMYPMQVSGLLAAAVETAQPTAKAKDIRIEVRCDPLPTVMGDLARLQQVLWNLLSNAIKFTPHGGIIRVAARRLGDRVELSVTDSGEGIASDFLPHVFERFRQADASSTRRHGGLGLGLAIVKQLIESHGGSVRAESSGRGQGASFAVTLPVRDAQLSFPSSPPRERPQHADVSLRGLELLVVDDEADSREVARRILTDAGARVTCAASAIAALEQFECRQPDVLVADIGMPDMDGYQMLERIRSRPPEQGGLVPAVAMTAFAHAEARVRSHEAGFQSHLAKPIDRAELLRIVKQLAVPAENL